MMKNKIGIVGGGQLGRMLVFAAKKMGFHITVLDPTLSSPAGQVADAQIVADFNDVKAIKKLAKNVDFLTFEIELANATVLEQLSKKGVVINPSAKTLRVIKDKLLQKRFLVSNKVSTAEFQSISNEKTLLRAIKSFGYPVVLKARFDGYDGRGNVVIQNESEIKNALKKLKERKLYVEKFIPFKKELSVIVGRNIKGEIKTYPVVETVHKNNICHIVIAPGRFPKKVKKQAEELARRVMRKLKGAGVFGIEMFLTKDNQVVVNEIAPRVHNSGHYTIEACVTSQFEQHIRAVTGLPLGQTNMVVPVAVMINILGERQGMAKLVGLEKLLKLTNVAIHIYGKIETKMERKMGHITVIGKKLDETLRKALKARKLISI